MFRYDRGVVGHSGYVFAQSRWVFGEYICLVVRRTGCLCVCRGQMRVFAILDIGCCSVTQLCCVSPIKNQ